MQQSLTSPYWTPPPLYNVANGIRSQNYKENDLGFRHSIPPPMPQTTGQYYGSNEGELYAPKKMAMTNQTGYFAPGNYVPTTDGRPLVNIYNPTFTFKREDHIRRV